MASRGDKTIGDNAFTAESLYGTNWQPTYAGALSFLRRKYTRDLTGVDVAVTRAALRPRHDQPAGHALRAGRHPARIGAARLGATLAVGFQSGRPACGDRLRRLQLRARLHREESYNRILTGR